jgi:hypothetical protein
MIAYQWGKEFDLAPCRSVPLIMAQINFVLMRGVATMLLANRHPAVVDATALSRVVVAAPVVATSVVNVSARS